MPLSRRDWKKVIVKLREELTIAGGWWRGEGWRGEERTLK